jgi:hypothetical protein
MLKEVVVVVVWYYAVKGRFQKLEEEEERDGEGWRERRGR